MNNVNDLPERKYQEEIQRTAEQLLRERNLSGFRVVVEWLSIPIPPSPYITHIYQVSVIFADKSPTWRFRVAIDYANELDAL